MKKTEKALENIKLDPRYLELAIKVMEMEKDVDENFLKPFEQEFIKSREGYNGTNVFYVSGSDFLERARLAFKRRFTFLELQCIEDTSVVRRWDKNTSQHVEKEIPYINVIGLLAVPGLGVYTAYGSKKIVDEATDVRKAAVIDAFKKCCEYVGIRMDYDDEDQQTVKPSIKPRVQNTNNYQQNNQTQNKPQQAQQATTSINYTVDQFNEACDHIMPNGKFKEKSLQEIFDEAPNYLEWMSNNFSDDNVKAYAKIVIDGNKNKPKTQTKPVQQTQTKAQGNNTIDTINKLFEQQDYDRASQIALIKDFSETGKSKLEQLNENELAELKKALEEE